MPQPYPSPSVCCARPPCSQQIHEYLRGVLAAQPPPAEASDKAALMCALRLAETTRTELPVLAAVLRELWQAKQLREDEVGGMGWNSGRG